MDDTFLKPPTPNYDRDLGTRKTGMIGASTSPPGKHGSRGRTAKGTLSRPLRRPNESDAAYARRLHQHAQGTFNGGRGSWAGTAVRHAAKKALYAKKAAATAAKRAKHLSQGKKAAK